MICTASRRFRPAVLAVLAAGTAAALAAAPTTQADATESPASAGGGQPRNVIVFIADGCGENTHRAFECWRGEPMIYQGPEWSRYDVTTYALRAGSRPSRGVEPLEQDPRYVYDYALASDTTPDEGSSGGYPFHVRGYRWLRATAPDSANTATSIFTGVSTYAGAINVDGAGTPVPAVSRAAADRGKAVGVVSTVPFSHATPACAAGTSVVQRDMYHEIAHQMLTSDICTVIAGGGHPEFDDNAKRRENPKYKFISEDDWTALKSGTLTPVAPAAGVSPAAWTFVDDVESVRSLAEGDTPERLFIVGRAAESLQQDREPHHNGDSTPPGGHPRNTGVPTLRELALAAINAVDDDPDGFFLMIEGGAVDWAMHDNQIGRVIEEMNDYHATIETVCAMLDSGERGFDWSDTLVIVTADHDHLLLGPDSDTVPFQPLEDRGKGNLPGFRWHSNSHSNNPVPLFARGKGAERFEGIATTPAGSKAVFHQTRIGQLLFELVSEPTAAASE
ncbi:MAG: alkaline phosphatase [Phycisphaerales bacterium JB054]